MVVAVTVAQLSQSHDHFEIPDDVIATMIFDTICDHAVAPLYGKRQSSVFDDPNPQKRPTLIEYDRGMLESADG